MKQIVVIFSFFCSMIGHAKPIADTLDQWRGRFYNPEIQKISPDGSWIIVRKNYQKNRDTVMVFSTKSPGHFRGTLEKMFEFSFIGGNILLASGSNRAVLWDLRNGERKKFGDIKSTGSVGNGQGYYLMNGEGNCSVYNEENRFQYGFDHVKYIRTDAKNTQTFLIRDNGKGSEIIGMGKLQPTLYYRTQDILTSAEVSASGKTLLIREHHEGSGRQRIAFIDVESKETETVEIPELKPHDFIRFTEIQEGGGYIITAINHIPVKNHEPDIWYGNDRNLESKVEGKFLYRHWVWNTGMKTLKGIPAHAFSTVVSLDNPRYYIAFNEDELCNYTTQFPNINASVYDMENDSYQSIGVIIPEISVSPLGRYILYRDIEKNWILLKTDSAEKSLIGKKEWQQPVFSSESRYIFFESKDDVKRYDLKNRRWESVCIAAEAEIKILNKSKKMLYQQTGYDFSVVSIEKGKPLLISTVNDHHKKAMVLLKGRKVQKIVGPVDFAVKIHETASAENSYWYIIENINVPPRLVFRDLKLKDSSIIFKSNTHDHTASILKKDIVTYKNTEGKLLKGILYYPSQFDNLKKYPMIVHLYGIQSRNSSQYLSPLNNFPVAFNIRLMLEKGYFVFLPDVTADASGIGWGALRCVNNALDRVQQNKNIDMTRVGLIGHSFGGYLTNFMATQSSRFATYISGAGAADMVRMYFSYNYTSNSPFYWQFESGQYPMGGSFAEHKDLYIKNSPVHHVEKVSAPILLWAGKEDQRISFDQVLEFYVGLFRNNKNVAALFYPGQAHVFKRNSDEEKDLSEKIIEWFDYFLKGRQQVEWINRQMNKNADR